MLRDPDPDSGADWQLRWERPDGSSALQLTADNVWQLDPQTLDEKISALSRYADQVIAAC